MLNVDPAPSQPLPSTTTPVACVQSADPPNGTWLPVVPMSGPVGGPYPDGQTITLSCPAVPKSTCQPTITCANGQWNKNPVQFSCTFCNLKMLHDYLNDGKLDPVVFPYSAYI